MNQMTQGEAVYQAVCAVTSDLDGKVELNDTQKKQVYQYVLEAFLSGATAHKSNPSVEELKKYIPGLVNNWLRKDTRLNGGSKYQTKKPGSRTGSGDEQLKAMRALLTLTTDPEAKAQIQQAISERQAELKPKVAVDFTKLPESLRHLVR